jgi:hypothetical protein
MGQKQTAVTGKNRIMIYGPKTDGSYLVEFRTRRRGARDQRARWREPACSNISRTYGLLPDVS